MRFIYLTLCLFIFANISAQDISTIAGNGSSGFSGDGGPATAAQLGDPINIITDKSGNLYIADQGNNVIRKVDAAGIITKFAGTGVMGYTGDGGPATAATLYHPGAMAFDNAGNFYFTDRNGDIIRKIDLSGIITTITGNLPNGYSGDGGPLMGARFMGIANIAFDNADNMYLTDFVNHVIRKVNTAGIITTFAGNGVGGFSGDGGPATAASLNSPYSVLFPPNGDILITDAHNNRIRRVDAAGNISTFAGSSTTRGYSGDGGPATSATFSFPTYASMDGAGNIYLVDALNWVIRKIDANGIVSTFAGTGVSGYSGDGGPAIDADLAVLYGIQYDPVNSCVYITQNNPAYVIRKVPVCTGSIITQQPGDVVLCTTGDLTFNIVASNASAYQWQLNDGSGWTDINNNGTYSGAGTAILQVSTASSSMNNFQFRCRLTDACGSKLSEVANLNVTGPVTPSISITGATTLCVGTSANFGAFIQNGGPNPSFQWQKNGINTGTNSASFSDNTLVDGDVITCILTSDAPCSTTMIGNSNSIQVKVTTMVTPTVSITASPNNICANSPVSFTSIVTNGGSSPSYRWFRNDVDMNINTPFFNSMTLADGDVIKCSVTSDIMCVSASTAISNEVTMSVVSQAYPQIVITASANAICRNTPVSFNAITQNGGSNPGYQWLKNGLPVGNNSAVYTDNSITETDILSCILTSNSRCVVSSQATSNELSIILNPDPIVLLDQKPEICEGSSRTLDAGNFNSYLWNDGSTNRSITINTPGAYSVLVTDRNGCTGTGFTSINTVQSSPKAFLPNDTAVCVYGNIDLKPNSPFRNYLWNTGSASFSINVSNAGLYTLRVTDNNGCTGTDTIIVRSKDCLQGFFMPNAFTPNHDGKNDLLRPVLLGNIKQYRFSVYNRWGQLVFETTDLKQGWNGIFNGAIQGTNMFAWSCVYQLGNEVQQFRKGTILLLR
ncbi:MAG: T9SS type B sorting domain-containing protein [Chitinophagaceae bacterium]|nr:MAG: T9SS type B sorting domain-containing protein [Chitinophagaceae bacterium]